MAEWDNFWNERDQADQPPPDDAWGSLVWQVGLEFWYEVFNKHAKARKLLECGCGSARVSQYMAARGYDCTMLDESASAIELAKRQFAINALNGSFVVGDINNLPYPDNSFDIVYSGGVLHHFQDIDPPIREMVRVLKPRGIFAATVIPRKLSCQTIANAELRLAGFVKGIIKLNFNKAVKDCFKPFNTFYVNSLLMKDYLKTCHACGLDSVCGYSASPFPNFSLPSSIKLAYSKFMRSMMPSWRKFNQSQSRLATIWGASYSIYGIKSKGSL